jgi:hypothetical protein
MIRFASVRIRGNTDVIAEMNEKGEWCDPYGGTFTPEEHAELHACARGERSTVCLGRGTKWQTEHFARVELLPAASSEA